MVTIVADQDIPFINRYFGQQCQLILRPGRAISRQDLQNADVLLVRSVTKVDRHLLAGTSVRFVGSATTGEDHLDLNWLAQNGITCFVAAGSNARAVVEYVVCIIAALQKKGLLLNHNSRAAVIGVGRIGSQVVEVLKLLGFEVVCCDPLRALKDKAFLSKKLEELADLDLIAIHTTLTHEGDYPTYHLINQAFLKRQKPHCILLNAGRGAVIDFSDLKQHGKHLYWCLDVWEDEPQIDLQVLQEALFATPHIAGYSLQSKRRAVEMIHQELIKQKLLTEFKVNYPNNPLNINFHGQSVSWQEVVLKVFNPLLVSNNMQGQLLCLKEGVGRAFDGLRKSFQERHEFSQVQLQNQRLSAADKKILSALHFTLL